MYVEYVMVLYSSIKILSYYVNRLILVSEEYNKINNYLLLLIDIIIVQIVWVLVTSSDCN